MIHGCKKCQKPDTPHPFHEGLTMEDVYQETMKREARIRERFPPDISEVNVNWECCVRDEKTKNTYMAKFFEEIEFTTPFSPRDTLFGGRTQPFCLYAEADEYNEINYLDFDSLYPSINYEGTRHFKQFFLIFLGEYMLGHPTPYTWYANVKWERPEDVRNPSDKIKVRHAWWQVQMHGPRNRRVAVIFYFKV